MNTNENKNPKPSVFWVLWAAILQSMIVLQFILVGGLPNGKDAASPPTQFYIICIVALTASLLIRLLLITKTKTRQKRFVLTVLGLALIDLAHVFQLFLIGNEYPQKQFDILCLSLVSIILYIPIYANKQSNPSESSFDN